MFILFLCIHISTAALIEELRSNLDSLKSHTDGLDVYGGTDWSENGPLVKNSSGWGAKYGSDNGVELRVNTILRAADRTKALFISVSDLELGIASTKDELNQNPRSIGRHTLERINADCQSLAADFNKIFTELADLQEQQQKAVVAYGELENTVNKWIKEQAGGSNETENIISSRALVIADPDVSMSDRILGEAPEIKAEDQQDVKKRRLGERV